MNRYIYRCWLRKCIHIVGNDSVSVCRRGGVAKFSTSKSIETLAQVIPVSEQLEIPDISEPSSPEVQKWCTKVMKSTTIYQDQRSLLEVLHTAVRIAPSTNAGIVRAALQMVRREINNLDVGGLIRLGGILSYLDSSKLEGYSEVLVKSLEAALPLALELRIEEKKFDTTNMKQLVSALKLAINYEISLKSINRLLSVILNHRQEISPPEANLIIYSLAVNSIENNPDTKWNLVKTALDICFEIMIVHIRNSNYQFDVAVRAAFRRLSYRKHPCYYNSEFTDAILKMLNSHFDSICSPKMISYLIHFFLTRQHLCPELLQKISSKLVEDSDILLDTGYQRILGLPEVFAEFFWKPESEEWRKLLIFLFEFLQRHEEVHPDLRPIKFMKSLLILGEHRKLNHLEPLVLESLSIPLVLLPEEEENLHRDILDISIAASNKNILSDTFIQSLQPYAVRALGSSIKNKIRISDFSRSIGGFAKLAFGGSEFVASNIWTDSGNYIDHLLMIDKESRRPISIGGNKEPIRFFDALQKSDNHLAIGLIPLCDADYSLQPYVLKGSVRLRLRELVEMGIHPLTIHYDSWSVLMDKEKAPFLEREIESISDANKEVYRIYYEPNS
ncbi:uncharacterized protein LOC141851337 [Brevipalpus obovatus]|uniref:uncharacterized protein LOC141851337 n=1 Tax=Brevipalpus obovatus TaxID=246614 RepID=UPI003D9F5193